MTSSKRDQLVGEKCTSDLERYNHAVQAMHYYKARVNTNITCADSRTRCKPNSPTRIPNNFTRIQGILPPTLPVTSKTATCYYHMFPVDQNEEPGVLLNNTFYKQQSLVIRDCMPSTSSAIERPKPVHVPTKKSVSSPGNQTMQMADKVRSFLSSSPTRTKIPIATNSSTKVKNINDAYFAPSPPAKPMPLKACVPSMCKRRDATHNCLNLTKEFVDPNTLKTCERVIAEAVSNNRSPDDINIPQAALKLIPPRKSVESVKDKTFLTLQRFNEHRPNDKSELNTQEPDIQEIESQASYTIEETDQFLDFPASGDCPSEHISDVETPSNLVTMSNDSSSEAKSSFTVREGSDSQHSDLTVKDTESNQQSCDLATRSLAECLLADIVQRFPSKPDLCVDIKASNKSPSKSPKCSAQEIINEVNNTLQHLNENSNRVEDVATTDFKGNQSQNWQNFNNAEEETDDEKITFQLKELAEKMMALEDTEKRRPRSPSKRCNVWTGSADDCSGYAHSTSTGLGFIAHNVTTTDTSRSSSDTDIRSKEQEYMHRTVSTHTSQIFCDFPRDREDIRPTSSHKGTQVSTHTNPPSDRALHMLLKKRSYMKESRGPSCDQDLHGNREEKVKRSMSSRLIADLKTSQQILGLVDAVLNNDDAVMLSGVASPDETVRLRSRTVANIHRSRVEMTSCQECRRDSIIGTECVRKLQTLRNEHIQHIQRQFQNIVSLNNFIDQFQSMQ